MTDLETKKIWLKYFRKALFATWFLRFLPYVRLVSLNGSMMTNEFKKDSDIDFFVAIKRGHLFTGRIMVTSVVHLLGLRRHGDKIAGRICLNRFASRSYLRITPENAYHARGYHNLQPLFSTGFAYEQFCQTNQWMSLFGYPIKIQRHVLRDSPLSFMVRTFFEIILKPFSLKIEKRAKKWQLMRIDEDPRNKTNTSRIVANDRELCFHLIKKST